MVKDLNVGVIALIVNVAVLALVSVVTRGRAARESASATQAAVAA
jgi:hypothetical protein